MSCGVCGTQVPDGSGFCPNCGSKIKPISVPQAVNIPAEPIPAPNIPVEPIPAPNISAGNVVAETAAAAQDEVNTADAAEALQEQAGWAAAVAAAQKAAAEQASRREAEEAAARQAEEEARREAEAAEREAAERAKVERVAREIAAQEEAAREAARKAAEQQAAQAAQEEAAREAARKAAEQQAAQAAQEEAAREAARKAAKQQAAQAAQEEAAREAARKAAEQQAAQAAQEEAAREAARKAAEQQAAQAAVQAAQAAAQTQSTAAAAAQATQQAAAAQQAQIPVTGAPQYQMINGHYVLVPKQLQQIQSQPQGVAPAPQAPTKSSKLSLGLAGGLAVLTLIFAFLALGGNIWLFFRAVDGRKWLSYDLIAAMAFTLYLMIGTCIFLRTKNYSYDFASPGMAVSYTLVSMPYLILLISSPSGYLRELPKNADQWLTCSVPILLVIGLLMIIGCASMMYPKKLNAANYAQKALTAKFLSVIHALVTLAAIGSIAFYDFWEDTLHDLIKQFDYKKQFDLWWLSYGTDIICVLAVITGLLMFVAAGITFRKSLTQK